MTEVLSIVSFVYNLRFYLLNAFNDYTTVPMSKPLLY